MKASWPQLVPECTCGIPQVRCASVTLFQLHNASNSECACWECSQLKERACEHNLVHAKKVGITVDKILHRRHTMETWKHQLAVTGLEVTAVGYENCARAKLALLPVAARNRGRPPSKKRIIGVLEKAKKRSRKGKPRR